MAKMALLLLSLTATDLPRPLSEEGLAKLAARVDASEAVLHAHTALGPATGGAVLVRIDDRAALLTTTALVRKGDPLRLTRPDGRSVPCTVVRVDAGLGLVELDADHGLIPVTGPASPAGPSYARWRDGAHPLSWSQELGPGREAEAFFRRLPFAAPRGQAVVDQRGRLRGLSFGPSGYDAREGLYVPWNAIHEFVVGRPAPPVLGEAAFKPQDFRF